MPALHSKAKKDQGPVMKEAKENVVGNGSTNGETLNQNQIRTEVTRQRIVQAAHNLFVENGLEGTRMEAIAAAAEVNKSLVYRHFGNRENLYREVLKRAYTRMRMAEAGLNLPDNPIEAIERIVSFTLTYYIENPDFLVLVGIENLNRGQHLRAIERELLQISGLVQMFAGIIQRGVAAGVFREDLDPVDFYTVVSSQCWFTVATRYTFGFTFEVETLSEKNVKLRELLIRDNVLRWALKDGASLQITAPSPA